MQQKLLSLSQQYPIVTITGPRQSGKTTLCKMVFPDMPYCSVEDLDTREFATIDPRGFLAQFPNGAIIDEIQRTPDLPSYIQGIVDEKQKNGLFILTGSQNFELAHTVAQSLAGRTALLKLLPFSMQEIETDLTRMSLDELMLTGFYPRIYDQHLAPTEALGFLYETYVERDVRALSNVHNLSLFQKFVKLCAGRVGQLLNLSGLGNEVGISHTTARQWLSLLEASYIVYLLQPHHKNYNKRITKSPKLYFCDVGMAAFLLGIQNEQQMSRDPLRGSLFENMIVMEFIKHMLNEAQQPLASFFRDSSGNEVDLILQVGRSLVPIEIKAGQTIAGDFFKGLEYFKRVTKDPLAGRAVVYGGKEKQQRNDIVVSPYFDCASLASRLNPS
jgi:predicted AAA+ superfamily ATPase